MKIVNDFKQKAKVVFFSFGSLEPGAPSARGAADVPKKDGEDSVNAYYNESPGTEQEWQSWRRSLREFAQLLVQHP